MGESVSKKKPFSPPAQTGLFGPFNPYCGQIRRDPYGGKPPSNASRTSRAAGNSIQAVLNSLQAKVFHHVRNQGPHGATCDEVEVALSMKHQTASARICELKEKRLLIDSETTRLTRSKRAAIVYVSPDNDLV